MMPRAVTLALALAMSALELGCEGCSSGGATAVGSDAGQAGLSPERAAQVLARVGTRTITLGDYAAALERMDPFERMRYQTDDRRQILLDEMINVELLAREAERRGLDRLPETQERVRQFQRDELLRRLRATLPEPTREAVREYYTAHRADFFEPERRRAAHIVLSDAGLAARVASEARGKDAEGWRALVRQYNPEALGSEGDKTVARPALEVPGDLGMLSAPGRVPEAAPGRVAEAAPAAAAGEAAPARAQDGAAEVPDVVRRAVFEIPKVGEVYPEPVAHAGRFHVLRLVSLVEARQLALEEVESAILARLTRIQQEQAEAELLARLRQTVSVSIDESALERVPEPTVPASGAPAPGTPAPGTPAPGTPAPGAPPPGAPAHGGSPAAGAVP